jgi:peptidoglycan/LPS O-acetylase OafA/YrhL
MRFGALDGWRGVCAILIAILHLNVVGWISGLPVISYSYLFVDFFFVLSGFVISHAYIDRIKDRYSLLNFLIRRFGRIYPLHFFVLSILVIIELFRLAASIAGVHMEVQPFSHATSLGKLATNLVLAQSLGLHGAGSWNYPSWSISVEFYTYIIFGALLFATYSLRSWVRDNILIVTMTLSATILIVNSRTGMFTTFELGLYRCIFGFIAGVMTYRAYRVASDPGLLTQRRTGDETRLRRVLSSKSFAAALESLAVLAVILFVVLAKYGWMSFAAPFIFSVAVFIFAYEAGPISTLLRSRPFALLGKLSYSIYMIHDVIAINVIHRGFAVIERLTNLDLHSIYISPIGETTMVIDMNDHVAGDFLIFSYIVAVIFLSQLTYRWIEVPWRDYFNRIADRLYAGPRALEREASL